VSDGPELQVGSDAGVARIAPCAEFVIGRSDGCDVVLTDLRVSRRHLGVGYVPSEGWVVRDLGSSSGTFQGAERLQRRAVHDALTVRLGDATSGPVVSFRTTAPDARDVAAPSVVTVGRAQDNDVVLPELYVSRHHAEFRRLGPDSWEVVDLRSNGGTFAKGLPVTRQTAKIGDEVVIGHSLLRLTGTGVELIEEDRSPTLEAVGASAILQTGQRILDEVSFSLVDGTFLALLGPTGSGKSTLLRTLTGFRPPEAGAILVNGLDLYESSAEVRQRIGYVPQDDILHPQLSIRRALDYSAELRFQLEVSQEERDQRVAQVIAELGLSGRADVAIERLSGGQRKRTSVAMELLTKPSLLLLDEPTSGLDPGYERSVMEQLKLLADGGRVVVVVTHSVQSLDLCDKVLFLAPGGTSAFFGSPPEALEFFDRSEYASVFHELEVSPPERWRRGQAPPGQALRQTPSASGDRLEADAAAKVAAAPLSSLLWRRQFSTLCRRQIAVLLADRRNLLYLLAEVLVPALLILALVGKRAFDPTPEANPHALRTLLGALAVSATAVGAANSVREVVKELPLYFRERAVGLSRSAYLVSKATVLGALTALQVAILVVIATRGAAGPTTSVWPGSPLLELMVDLALGAVAATCLGLLLSTVVSSSEKAMALIPVVFIVMWLFSGMAVDLQSKPLLRTLGYATSANWAMSMASSSTSLFSVEDRALALQGLPSAAAAGGQMPAPRDARWNHGLGNWLVGALALIALSAGSIAAADLALARKEPFARRRPWLRGLGRQGASDDAGWPKVP
jgi:ABC transport system ATP-binding/permease protein